ncbi:hypothetical protein U062_01843 [Gammaproteobacteria bacterium MOLA455]|nr:hypothetical protein U062_01843 [Gammaproteobacteria bacterium MOLA455]
MDAFVELTQVQLLYPHELAQQTGVNPVNGSHTINEALQILLRNTDFSGDLTEGGVIVISHRDHTKLKDREKTMERGIKNKKTVLAGFVALFAAGVTTQGAMAQDGEAATTQSGIDEIIVTATKRAQNIQDVPISILAFQGEDLAAQGVTDLQSLSLAVPGLLVAESGAMQRRISIRGVGNIFGSSSLIGMYLDEASVASLPSNQIDLRIHDLERIEVLKGPQGTLYGEGSVGGAIRYITNDPQLDAFGAEVSFDASSTKDGSPSQETKAIINIPLVEDSLGLRVVGQYINSGGWIDQPALGKSDINDYELFNIRTKLLWMPSDSLEVKVTAVVHRNDTGAQNIGEDDSGNFSQAFGDLSTPSAEDSYNLYNVLVNYDLGNATLVSSTGYLGSNKKVNNDGNYCCFPTGVPGELWNLLTREGKNSADIFTQELRLSSSVSGPLLWSAGLFYKDAELVPFDNIGFTAGVPGGTVGVDIFNFPDNQQEEESKSWALFGETSYVITDQLEMGAGLRYFEDDRRFRAGGVGAYQEESFDSLNPKVYVKYDVNDDLNVFLNVAQGFRSGGFNVVGPAFDPETVLSYELGSKMSLLDGRLKADFALFHSVYEDYQIIGLIPSLGLNITSNAGEAEIMGVEWSLTWQVNEQVELGFNGNYMDTEFVEINATNSSHVVGDAVDLVPRYGYSLWGSYGFNWSEKSEGFIRVDYSEQGKSNYRNRSFASDYLGQSDIVEMLNLRLGWSYGDWSVDLYGLNLLNERGFIGPLAIEANSARPRPRTVGLELGFKF